MNRGAAWDALSQVDSAIADYTAAIRLDPGLIEVYYPRGMGWFYKQEYDKAIADFTEAIRFDPENDAIYYDRATPGWRRRTMTKPSPT